MCRILGGNEEVSQQFLKLHCSLFVAGNEDKSQATGPNKSADNGAYSSPECHADNSVDSRAEINADNCAVNSADNSADINADRILFSYSL